MKVSDAQCLKAVESGNVRLKKLLAETMLDNAVLKDINSKNDNARGQAIRCGSCAHRAGALAAGLQSCAATFELQGANAC
jgi:putative transposase